MTTSRVRLRYRWSHRHPVHRSVVRVANRLLAWLPFTVKYAVVDAIRGRILPYRLVGPDSVVIQIGAPSDTLRAGRSRAMTFARRTRSRGRLMVVEPDPAGAAEFQRVAERHGLLHVDVVATAAWSERTSLTLKVDPAHPATNFTRGAADYAVDEQGRFDDLVVDATPVDDLVERAGLRHTDLVSITTNGAEEAVLRGLTRTLQRDRPYVCLARTKESYAELMAEFGYVLVGGDDRGFTFQHREGRRE